MKYLVILVLATMSSDSFGQDGQSAHSNTGNNRLQVGVNFSPDLAYRTLRNVYYSSPSQGLVVDVRNNNEIVKLGYTGGLNIQYHINSRVGIQTGLQYSDKGYQTKRIPLFFEQPNPGDPPTAQSVYHYQYLEVPLQFTLRFGRESLKFVTGAGITTNILIKQRQKVTYKTPDGNSRKSTFSNTSDYETLNLTPTVSLGLEYQMDAFSSLRLEPTFRYGILKIVDAPVTAYLWNCGLNMSYFFSLRK